MMKLFNKNQNLDENINVINKTEIERQLSFSRLISGRTS